MFVLLIIHYYSIAFERNSPKAHNESIYLLSFFSSLRFVNRPDPERFLHNATVGLHLSHLATKMLTVSTTEKLAVYISGTPNNRRAKARSAAVCNIGASVHSLVNLLS